MVATYEKRFLLTNACHEACVCNGMPFFKQVCARSSAVNEESISTENASVILDGKGRSAACGMMNAKCLTVTGMDIA